MRARTIVHRDTPFIIKPLEVIYDICYAEYLLIPIGVIELFCPDMHGFQYWCWEWISNNENQISTVSSIFISVCLAIFPILLSIDSDSLLMKLDINDIKKIVCRLSFILFASICFIVISFFEVTYFSKYWSILFVLFIILIIEIFKLGIQFSIVIYKGIYYRRSKISHSESQQKLILEILEHNKDNSDKLIKKYFSNK